MERTYNVTLIRGSRSPMHKWTHMKRTQITFLRVPENTLDWVERVAEEALAQLFETSTGEGP